MGKNVDIMNINWDDAPEWANFLAVDYNEDAWWYEKEPEIDIIHKEWSVLHGKIDKADRVRPSWADTLQRRPKDSRETRD